MASIEIKGVDELIKKLGKVEGVKVLEAPMKRATARLHRDISDADNVPKLGQGEWAAWVNSHNPEKARKIRAAYWARVKEAGRHPGRTGKLAASWTIPKFSRSANGLTGKIGTNRKYAPFVQSHRFQARLHAKRWPTDQEVVDKNRQAIVADFERAIKQALK